MARIEPFGTTTGNPLQAPTDVHRITLANDRLEVRLLTLGAAIDDVVAGGESVVLSLDSVAEREDPARNPYFGVTVGRYANRLGGGRFTIDGVEYTVDANEGPNQLHGGPVGFSHVVWSIETTGNEAVFRRTSPDGEMGFPGTLEATVSYRLAGPALEIEYEAATDRPTVVSLTNHAYWNLGGPSETDVSDHVVTVDASHVVPVDDASLPAGPPIPVAGGPFDLRSPTRLGDRIGIEPRDGYDHCFLPDGDGFRRHARIEHPGTGRALEVWSDQPAAQLYTGMFLPGGVGAHGRSHERFAGLCVEPQHIPNAPNLSWAPSPVLRPTGRYLHRLALRFEET